MSNKEDKKVYRFQNIKYLRLQLDKIIFQSKVIFALNIVIELFLFYFSWSHYKNTVVDSNDFITFIFVYIIFSLPTVISAASLSMKRREFSFCIKQVESEIEDDEYDSAYELVKTAKETTISQLAILIIAFAFFSFSVF